MMRKDIALSHHGSAHDGERWRWISQLCADAVEASLFEGNTM